MVNEKGDEEVSNTSSGDETLDDDEQVDNDVAQHEIERAFPDAFYDPTTDQVMTDPVINPIGDSYNESTMFDSFVTYYPNRALKAIIDREIETESTSIRGSLLRIDDSIRSTIMNAVSITGLCEEVRPLPDSFYCPITCELIVDPVVSPDGNTYERAAIVEWLSEHDVSPITRDPLTLSELRPNNALYKLIQQEKSKSVESQHPSIRQWQESGVDTSTRNQEPLENATTYEPQPLRSAPVDPPADEEPAAPPASSHFSVTKTDILLRPCHCIIPAMHGFVFGAHTI